MNDFNDTDFGVKGVWNMTNQISARQGPAYWLHDTYLGVFAGSGYDSADTTGRLSGML